MAQKHFGRTWGVPARSAGQERPASLRRLPLVPHFSLGTSSHHSLTVGLVQCVQLLCYKALAVVIDMLMYIVTPLLGNFGCGSHTRREDLLVLCLGFATNFASAPRCQVVAA